LRSQAVSMGNPRYQIDFEGRAIQEGLNMTIRIMLADDHEIMREGMCALLKRRSDMEVVGQAGDGRTAVSVAKDLVPDVVIMDIGMPNLNGVEATRQLLTNNPKVKVMALSALDDGLMVSKMLKAGAGGYMHKDSAFTELMDGIDALMEGKIYLCSKISKVVFSGYVNMLSNPAWSGKDLLTSRENEVLQLVAEGKTTKDIAKALYISDKTVGSHRDRIMEKLSIHNVAGLTKYAVREGITSPW
jgi:two-component system response regulator NreC